MNEQQWITSTDPAAMLAFLRTCTPADVLERKSRRWACECSQIADNATKQELADWEETADKVFIDDWCRYKCDKPTKENRCDLMRCIFGNPWNQYVRDDIGRLCHTSPAEYAVSGVLGPVTVVGDLPAWLTWHDGTIPKVAAAIHEERAWWKMGVLADAIEEAGCAETAILDHLRGIQWCEHCKRTGHEVDGEKAMAIMEQTKDLDTAKIIFYGIQMGVFASRYCRHCNGTKQLKGDPPVRCRGDWCIELFRSPEREVYYHNDN